MGLTLNLCRGTPQRISPIHPLHLSRPLHRDEVVGRRSQTTTTTAAVCTLTASSPRLPHLPRRRPNVSSRTHFATTVTASAATSREAGDAFCSSFSGTWRRLVGVGMGVLASAFVALDADATRVQYYATVGEPLCGLSFVKSGLGYCDVAVGTGVEPPLEQLINIHYTARFADGMVFDSSYKRGRPLTMRIGVGKVLPGLEQGIMGGGGVSPMFVGGKRKLQIPPKLAYGPEPAGCFSGDCNIPANATLLYDILFVGVYK